MKIKVINSLIITLILYTSASLAQSSCESVNEYHNKGLMELNEGEIAEAESLFYYSAKEFSCAPSYFELAKIEFDKNTVYSRRKAREYIQKAIWKDPENIEFRMLQAKLMEVISSDMGYDVYNDILEIDSGNTDALYNLGRISEERFYEYHNSFMNNESGPALSFNDYAYNYFLRAEDFFKRAIKSDPGRTETYLHLSYLYSETGKYEKGIPLLNKVIQIDSLNKNAWLFLGYLYYKTLRYDHCQHAYKRALDLMSEVEREEFKISTTMMLLGDEEIEQDKIDNIVNNFWNLKDPLFLTKYNERLLEHYSRVAYSNLKFSVVKQNVTGWKSDRGEIMLRYGEPANRIRFRPYINAGGKTKLMLKTDLWVYKNKSFGFTDDYWTNNFRFSTAITYGRYFSQFQFDTYTYVKHLRRSDPEEYEPRFKGPLFSLPYEVFQFKDLSSDENRNTQIYLNYALDLSHNYDFGNRYTVPHQAGLFLLDGTDKIAEKVEDYTYLGNDRELKLNRYERYWVNSLETEAKPDSLTVAFEIVRDIDGGVSTNHFKVAVKDFDNRNLDMSDIVLAAGIERESLSKYPLIRNNIGILPNPARRFDRGASIFLYYEVYNLGQDEERRTSFEQKISIKKTNENSFIDDVISSVVNLFSSKQDDEVTLTTDYQSLEKNTQVYLQLDMDSYSPGDYIITVNINDKLTGSKTSSETLLKWRR